MKIKRKFWSKVVRKPNMGAVIDVVAHFLVRSLSDLLLTSLKQSVRRTRCGGKRHESATGTKYRLRRESTIDIQRVFRVNLWVPRVDSRRH